MFESPCPYVPLSEYDWKFFVPYLPPTGCPEMPWNPVVFCLDAAFQAVTIWMGLELNIQLFFRFKNKKSVYFWSIFACLWGAVLFTSAGLAQHYTQNQYVLATCILDVGWVAMVTGFSFTLYSRLYLLRPSNSILRVVFWAIVINAFLFHIPVVVTTIAGNIHPTAAIGRAYSITSYTEIAFSVQETVIASLYIYLFLQYVRDAVAEPTTRLILYRLIAAEFVVLSTDVVFNVLLYTQYYVPRTMIQAFMSMVKLKIEFIVLNFLVKYAHARANRNVRDVLTEPIQAQVFAPFVGEMSLSGSDTVAAESPSLERDGSKNQFSPSPGGSADQQDLV